MRVELVGAERSEGKKREKGEKEREERSFGENEETKKCHFFVSLSFPEKDSHATARARGTFFFFFCSRCVQGEVNYRISRANSRASAREGERTAADASAKNSKLECAAATGACASSSALFRQSYTVPCLYSYVELSIISVSIISSQIETR